jgi:hypothetical protein
MVSTFLSSLLLSIHSSESHLCPNLHRALIFRFGRVSLFIGVIKKNSVMVFVLRSLGRWKSEQLSLTNEASPFLEVVKEGLLLQRGILARGRG